MKAKLVTSKANRETKIELDVSTMAEEGLLLSKRSESRGTSLELRLEGGLVVCRLKFGRDVAELSLVSEVQVADGARHQVVVHKLRGGAATLQVDDSPAVEGLAQLQGGSDKLDTRGASLYIGGRPGELGLVGCLHFLGISTTINDGTTFGTNSEKEKILILLQNKS